MVVAAGRCQRSRSIGDLPVLALGMAESSTNCASSDAGEAPNSCTTRRRAPRPLSGRASLTRFRHSRRRRLRPAGQESHNHYAHQGDRDRKRQVILAGGVEYQPGHDRPCHQRKHHRRSCHSQVFSALARPLFAAAVGGHYILALGPERRNVNGAAERGSQNTDSLRVTRQIMPPADRPSPGKRATGYTYPPCAR